MSTTTQRLAQTAPGQDSWLARINSVKHFQGLKVYVAIMIAHWIEHIVQAFQVYVLRMPRPEAGGFLGYLYPAANKSEVLHWTYAVIMLIGLLLLRRGFAARSRIWWNIAIGVMVWHFFEHSFLFFQYWSGWHFTGTPVPTSVIQTIFPRVELHLIYNMLVMIPVLAALSVHWLGPKKYGPQGSCNCREHFAD